MTDLHMHILWGLDDGAEEIEEALAMAETSVECGVKRIAATVHANLPGQNPRKFLSRYRETFDAFCRELKKQNVPLQVCPGMELFANEHLPERLRRGELLTLNQSRYPLVEFDRNAERSWIWQILRRLKEAGYHPVLAHPERYRCIKDDPEILYAWYEAGILLQINAGSLLGHFGREAKHTAHWMLRHCLAGIVASDAHDPFHRTTNLEETADILTFFYGIDSVSLLLSDNPDRILDNRPVIRPEALR